MKYGIIPIVIVVGILMTIMIVNNKNYEFNENAVPAASSNVLNAPHDDFSEQTRAIIDKSWAEENINEHTYNSIMAKYGGYENYLKHLGGVFAKYGGIDKKIEINSQADFQEAAEYVYGLMAIFGFDYSNTGFHQWGADNDKVAKYSYYTNPGRGDPGDYSSGDINRICSHQDGYNGKGMRTNCNTGADTFFQTTNIDKYLLSGVSSTDSYVPSAGIRINSKNQLKVGDLVHFYRDDNQLHHVAIVGEKDEKTGDLILYDSGNRFIRTGRFKHVFNGEEYDYAYWKGTRIFDLKF